MPDIKTPDFKALHHEAAIIVKSNPLLAYAVTKELRKSLVGRESEAVKHDLLSHLAIDTWNEVARLQQKPNDHNYTRNILELFTETLILAYDILTERIGYGETGRGPR